MLVHVIRCLANEHGDLEPHLLAGHDDLVKSRVVRDPPLAARQQVPNQDSCSNKSSSMVQSPISIGLLRYMACLLSD